MRTRNLTYAVEERIVDEMSEHLEIREICELFIKRAIGAQDVMDALECIYRDATASIEEDGDL